MVQAQWLTTALAVVGCQRQLDGALDLSSELLATGERGGSPDDRKHQRELRRCRSSPTLEVTR
jgi:hypothetical protein